MAAILIRKFEKIEIEQDEFLEFGEFYLKYQNTDKSIILTILALILVDFILHLKNFDLTRFIIASSVKGIIFFTAFKYGFPNLIMSLIFKRTYKKIVKDKITDVSVGDSEITIEGNNGKANYQIDQIEDVVDLSKIIVIKFNRTTSQIIPKRYFENEIEASDFCATLKSKIALGNKITNNDVIDELKGDFKYKFKYIEFEFEDYMTLINCRKIDYKTYLISLSLPILLTLLCVNWLIGIIPFALAVIISIFVFCFTYWFFLVGLYIFSGLMFWFFNKKALDLPKQYNLYFDEFGCKSNGRQGDSQFDYSQMSFFKEKRNSFVFSSNYYRVFILPKRYFINQAQLLDFREFIRAHFDKAKLKK